ncbi:50S ribosomal protein L11 methyltransferase [Alkalicella caledoniensis]|uniref:Ribosomal protein L11 methyltransferase n=1 Tax=Alkalicella caledoniensis TaxID=2731377 RepID=A0A7G9W4F6_ALKCA|nr:50S ribosomal protein L11 methyltransferase [Alkalicella caledoniensis]QNO13568.1 50S ribosomal protein L11 methyltransferase [Alkalicella caledoniensis]
MDWLEVKINTEPLYSEAICNFIHEMGVGGVVIEDQQTVEKYIESKVWDYYSEEVHVLAQGVTLKCYLPTNLQMLDTLSAIRSYVASLEESDEFSVTTTQVSEQDWENHWKKYYKTVHVTPQLVIKPRWEEYTPKPSEKVIELDPGMAFGTGTHPTTNLCMKKISTLVNEGDKCIDVGCGSGILSIAAALFGAQVIGLDIDPQAVKCAKENVELNKVQDKVEIKEGNLLSKDLPKCDILVANIIADVILNLIPQTHSVLKDNGFIVLSGIILHRQRDIIECLNNYNYAIKDIEIDGEWVAITAQRMG